MSHPSPDPELRRLTLRMLEEGTLSDDDSARLRTLLLDPASRTWFLTMVQQEALLETAAPRHFETRGTPAAAPPRTLRFARYAATLAAAVAFGVGAGLFLAPRGPRPEARVSPAARTTTNARITAMVGVKWTPGPASADPVSGVLAPDRVALDAGLAEITYSNGVRVTIEGPCDYRIGAANNGTLGFGKLVARVPHGAEGFRVDYGRGHIVDRGTEFAVDLERDGAAEIGVFEGLIELYHDNDAAVLLSENQSVRTPSDAGGPEAVPLDRDKFVRRVPSREFRWEGRPGKTVKFTVDVSHLVWKAADYRILFKTFGTGFETTVSDVRLLLDGKPVARDPHRVTIGAALFASRDCLFDATVAERDFKPGRWTVEATLQTPPSSAANRGQPVGILQFEEGLVSHAVAADFEGAWEYSHLGHRYRRVLHPGGALEFIMDGLPAPKGFVNPHWYVRDGILYIDADNIPSPELHLLRDRDTLIFANRPYENAKRVFSDKK